MRAHWPGVRCSSALTGVWQWNGFTFLTFISPVVCMCSGATGEQGATGATGATGHTGSGSANDDETANIDCQGPLGELVSIACNPEMHYGFRAKLLHRLGQN